jgi:hypothetical protein
LVHEEQAQGIRGRLLAVSRLVQVLRVIRIHEMDDETMHACCPCLLEMMRCMSRANAATTMNYYWVPACIHARLGRESEEEETPGRQLVSGRGSFVCKVPSVQADNAGM